MASTDPADRAPDNSGDWDPIKALKNLTLENALDSVTSPEDTAKRLFKENLPLAVMAICHMASYSDSEVMRLNAAKFVVERTMGPAERGIATGDTRHAWDDIYNDVTTQAEEFLRKN
jgi:hypothetical protein